MGSVGTPIIGRPRPSSSDRRAQPATPSTAKSLIDGNLYYKYVGRPLLIKSNDLLSLDTYTPKKKRNDEGVL